MFTLTIADVTIWLKDKLGSGSKEDKNLATS